MKDRNDRDSRNYDSRKTKANTRSRSYPATDAIRETKRNAYPLTNDPQRQYNADSTQRYYNDSTQRQYNGGTSQYNGSSNQYNGSSNQYNGSTSQYNGSTAQYNGSSNHYNGSTSQYNGSTAKYNSSNQYNGSTSQYNGSSNQYNGSSGNQYNSSNTQRQYGSTAPFGRIADVVDQYKTAASSNDRRYYDASNSSRRYNNGEVLLDVPSLPGNSRTARRNGGDLYAPNFSMGDVAQMAKDEHDKNRKRGFFSNFKRSRSPERTLPQYTAPNSYRMIQGQPTIAKVNPYGYVTRNTVGSYHSTGYYDQGYQPPEVHGTGYYKGKGGYNYPPEPEFTHYEKYIEEPKSYSVSDVAGFVVDTRDKKGKNKTAKELPPPTRTTQIRYDTVEGTNFDSLMMSNPRNGGTLNNTGYVVNGSTTNGYRDSSYNRSTAYNVTQDSRDRNTAYTNQNYYDGKVMSTARDAYDRTTMDKSRGVSGMNTVSGANAVPSMNTVSGMNTVTYPRTVADGVSSKAADNAGTFNVAGDGNSLKTSTQAQEISTLAQQQTRNIGEQALPEESQSVQVNNVPPADGRMSAIREETDPFPPNGKTKNDSSETAVNDAGTNSDTTDTGDPEIKDAGGQPSKNAGDAENESTGDQKMEENGEMKPDDGGDPENKEAELLENTEDTVTNEITDLKTNSTGGSRANSAGGSKAKSAEGSRANSAGDSKTNSAGGSKAKSAGGLRANSAGDSKTNSAGGSTANSTEGSKTNSADGSETNSTEVSKTDSAGDSKTDTIEHSKTDSTGGSKTNSAGGSKINSAGGSKTDTIENSKTDSTGGSKTNSAGGSKTNSAGGSKTDSGEGSKIDGKGGSKTNSAGGSKTDSGEGSKIDGTGGSKTNSAGGASKTDSGEGSKIDGTGGSKTNSAGGSKTDSGEGSKIDSTGGSKTDNAGGSKTNSAGGSKTSSTNGSKPTSAQDPKTNSTEGSRATSAKGSKTNSTKGSDTKEPGDRATMDTSDSNTISGGDTNIKDTGGQTVKVTGDSVAADAVFSTTNAYGDKITKETKAKGDGYSKKGKTKDTGKSESRELGVKGSGEPIVEGVGGDSHQKMIGTETPSDDANTLKEKLDEDAEKIEAKVPDKPSKTDDDVAPVHTSGDTADKNPNKEGNPVENKRSKFGGIFSSQSKKNSGKPIKPPTIIRRSIVAPKFIKERIIGKRKIKTVEPSKPNDNESSNSNDKKTKVDSANAEGGDTTPAKSNGADNVATTSGASKPSSSLGASVDTSKAVAKARKTSKDKNLTKMSTIPSKSTIKNGAVSEKGFSESSGPKIQSQEGSSDSPTKLSDEDAKIIEELKSLRTEISKLDGSEEDEDGNDDSNEKGDETTKEKEGGGVQRSRSLVAVTGQTTPRPDSSLSLNSKSTKAGETNGDSSDSKIHSQKHELKSDSEATNGEAGEQSEEQTDQSGSKEQTALDQSIPADGEKGSPGAEDSGGKASTEGSGEKSAEGPAVSEGTQKNEEREGKEDTSDVDKGKEGDSDKVAESEKNPDQVNESDNNKENNDEKEEKHENVNEEGAEKSSEKTSDPEKVNDEGSSDDKEKDSEKDTEKVEKDDKSADKVESQEKDSDEIKEGETKEGGETEVKDQNSEKKEGSETGDKDKNTDKKDDSPAKEGEEKPASQESDAKSPNSRGDAIVEALEESARSNTGDLADPTLAEKTDETEMPFHLKPRGPSMASVERPENVISTVSMAVANSTALGAGTRTVGLGDQLTGGRPFLDRFDASDSLWQKNHGPLEVKPPTELGPNKPALQGKGSLDDEMAQWNNKVKESRGAQTVRIKNQEPRHSILKTTDAKYGSAPSKKDDTRPSLKDKALHLSEPIIIASGIVPESLEYLTSEYQAAINGKLNVNAKTGNNTNNGNKGNALNPISTTGNKNGNNKVAFNNAFDNSGGGNNYYNINNANYNNGSNAVPYGQTGVAAYNSYNNTNNKIGTMNATNLNPAYANGLITAPLAAPQHKSGQAEDVFDRLHSNKKNPVNAPGAVTNTKAEVPPKATAGKEPLDAKATMKAAAKTAATGNAVVAAVNNNKNTLASDANRKNQKNAAGGVVGGGVVGGGVVGGGGGGGGAAGAGVGAGAGADVFSRLYQAPKKRSDTVADDKAPSDDAKKDGTKNPVRGNNVKGIANAKKGQGDSVINMPLPSDKKEKATIGLTPDIVVDDTGDPAPIHGANMGQGGQSGDPTKIPIVLLQGFFRGPGTKSPHHRRPSLAVSEMALPPDLVDVTSMIRGALPVLPRSLAALCLTLNIVVPGLGTMLSGWLGICWGRNRLAAVETGGTRMTSVVVTGVTGLVQLFTVTFFLVGWFWGVAWGILLVSISNKYASFCSEHRSSISGSVNLEMLTVNAS